MPDPVAAASRFSGFPAWVLLDPFASLGECRNRTTAISLTSTKRPIEVSFELVDPPRVSRWFVRFIGRKKKRGFHGRPHILNSSGSFVVMRMSFYRDDGPILDYFVYKAGPGKPSLDLIPGPCPTVDFPNLVGILPSDDGGHYSVIFPVPQFSNDPNPMYEIMVFSSADQLWSTKFASICPDSETTYHDAVVHHPSKAIAIGRGSLAWIDLWRGVLLCDGLDEDNPVLGLIEWPVPLPCSNAMDLYSPDASRDAMLRDGTIRFVEIKFHYSGFCFYSRDAIPIGWTATMWKTRCSLEEWEWEMCFEVDIAKILINHSSSSDSLLKVWDTKSNKLDLNKVSSALPTLSLTNEDVVYFMTNLFSNEALLIAVNARKKKLEAVELTSFDLLCSPVSLSKLLDASSGIDTANQLDECNNRDNAEHVETSLRAALDELKDIGGGGRQREENGMTDANGGGAALRGSVGEVESSVEDKVVAAEHSSATCTGAQVIATELSENRLINCGSSENVFLEDTDTGAQINASELSENDLVDCSNNSIEIVNEGSGTELLIACTNGSQNIVGHPAEQEDSFDEYQVASYQSDSEDGAAPSSVFSTEMNNLNLNAISAVSSVTTNVSSLETNGLLKDQFSGGPNMTDLSADSNAGRNLEEGALRLAEQEVSLKLGGPYGQVVNVDYTYTDMIDSKCDEASVCSEIIGCLNASSLQETCLIILEPESESTCSKNVEGFMEDRMHVLHTMPEVSPVSEVVGSDNVQLEATTSPSTNPMSIGSDLNVVCTANTATDCSMELPRQNCSVEDVPGDTSGENSSKKTLRCPTAVIQDDLLVTKMDDTPVTNVDDVEFNFQERPQTDTVEENLSIHKTNRFTKEEVCNMQIDPEIPTEDQFSMSQKHDSLLLDQSSSVKNPFNLDNGRNDDLFELPTESCFLKVQNAVESRQQVDSTFLMVDQPTFSNQTRMAEVQQCHNSNERILSASSASENGEVVAPEDIPVSSSTELVNKTCLTDHGLQENGHTSGDMFVPSQAASTELCTVSMQDISALTEVEEIMQTKDANAKDMTAVCSIDCIEMKQAINTTANDTYAANVEEKKLIEGSPVGMNEVRQTEYVEEQTQASDTKELSAVQNIGNFEENKQTEDTDAKETNMRFNENDVEHKTQTAKEMATAESTYIVEEKQQLNTMVGQDGSNNKLNEEIEPTGARMNSGRVRAPLKVFLAEASKENQVKKPSTKERVLSFRRWVTKDSNLSVKSGSPKSGFDDHHWSSPAKLEKKTGAQLNSGRVRIPLKVLAEASMENKVKKPSTKERVLLPHKDVVRSSKGNKQQWMPVICCHSVR